MLPRVTHRGIPALKEGLAIPEQHPMVRVHHIGLLLWFLFLIILLFILLFILILRFIRITVEGSIFQILKREGRSGRREMEDRESKEKEEEREK